jgi:hypothetical protein
LRAGSDPAYAAVRARVARLAGVEPHADEHVYFSEQVRTNHGRRWCRPVAAGGGIAVA